MTRYVLDTNLYIAANRDPQAAEALAAFYAANLPSTHLHATVAQELMLGTRDAVSRRRVRDAYLRPFELRGRVIVPSYQTWLRSGELVAMLVQRRVLSPGGFSRSFLNDAVIAASCREHGLTLLTANERDFARLRQVEHFNFVSPWPVGNPEA
ncbi:MAG TPA: type II toxin-antitoxin system VapC family toxin [Gemmatimonadales bacterium]|nr:type II toxin-antitoxin system VapC family toxin [Gemmatimonadales bacterium]